MDLETVRAAYDEQVRRNPVSEPGQVVERADGVVRVVGPDGWSGVTWSDLGDEPDLAVHVRRFQTPWEWKHYSYDQPADLPDRLVAAGFNRGPAETVLVAELAELDLTGTAPPGLHLRPVEDAHDVAALVAVHDEVFGGDGSAIGRTVLAGLAAEPATVAAVLAWDGDRPVAAGRLELPPSGDFAGLWGGGTVRSWRGRGVFTALVARRAALAAAAGYRYLQVDAMPTSRPILMRLGFTELATTTPFTHPGTVQP